MEKTQTATLEMVNENMILLMGLLFWSCEDDRNEEPLVESIQMWVNGTEIMLREYYESITTYGLIQYKKMVL